jgi:hypothetical protein
MMRVSWNRANVVAGIAEPHAEDQDHQDADDEGRQRDADEGYREEHPRQPRVPLETRVHAHRHPDEQGHHCRYPNQLDGRGQALDEQLVDGLADTVGEPELALRRVREIAHELDRDGIVQPELLAQALALLVGPLGTEHVVDRVADELEQREADEAHD